MTNARWRAVLWVGTLLILAYLAWSARQALFPFAVGAIIAYALTPVVDSISRLIPWGSGNDGDVYRRGLAVAFVYLVFGGILVGLGLWLIPIAVDELSQFIDNLPDLWRDAKERVDEWLVEYRERTPEDVQARVDEWAEQAGPVLADQVAAQSERWLSLLTGTISVVFGFLVVPFWMFYALRDRRAAARNFDRAVPEEARDDVGNVLAMTDRLLGRYLRGQLFLGVIVGLAVGIGLTLLDIELAIALGVFAGITELIPIIGPWLGGVPAVVIVAATDPGKLPWVAALYIVVQQLENNLLVPRVQGHAVELHPAIVILLLVVGGATFGFIGLLVVVPLSAMLREIFWYADHRLRGRSPAEALEATNVGPAVARERRRRIEAEERRAQQRAAAQARRANRTGAVAAAVPVPQSAGDVEDAAAQRTRSDAGAGGGASGL